MNGPINVGKQDLWWRPTVVPSCRNSARLIIGTIVATQFELLKSPHLARSKSIYTRTTVLFISMMRYCYTNTTGVIPMKYVRETAVQTRKLTEILKESEDSEKYRRLIELSRSTIFVPSIDPSHSNGSVVTYCCLLIFNVKIFTVSSCCYRPYIGCNSSKEINVSLEILIVLSHFIYVQYITTVQQQIFSMPCRWYRRHRACQTDSLIHDIKLICFSTNCTGI